MPRGLLVDYGGVLTTDVFASFRAFCAECGIAPDAVRELFRTDPAAYGLLVGLETGTLPDAEFEARFGALLGVPTQDLIAKLMARAGADHAMIDTVRAARRAGLRTGLVSNSWGVTRYDRAQLSELFDGVVISGEIGLRKPDPRIYALGAEAVGLPPEECVYVDDLPGNLKPARALGMTTVHHRDAASTIAELERIFGTRFQDEPCAAEP
jgi:epoxide hydrolase-like predicted phosphatase